MIVYNVKRRFFVKKDDADSYRKAEGLKPSELSTIEVFRRDELAALLNALCDPTPTNVAVVTAHPVIAPEQVIDNAYVPTDKDVPKFLRESWSKING